MRTTRLFGYGIQKIQQIKSVDFVVPGYMTSSVKMEIRALKLS